MSYGKTTRNEVYNRFPLVFQVGYCGLYPLANYFRTVAHGSGYLGWNYDVVEISPRAAVVTGYRALFGREIPEKAARILRNAAKYDHDFNSWQKPYTVRENYMKRAARRFAAALEDDNGK